MLDRISGIRRIYRRIAASDSAFSETSAKLARFLALSTHLIAKYKEAKKISLNLMACIVRPENE